MGKYTTENTATSIGDRDQSGGDGIIRASVPATLADLRMALDRQRKPRNQDKVVTLGTLREWAGKTQGDVARTLGLAQGNISKLENRGDLRLSSLRSYLGALDMKPQVSVVYKGRSYLLDLGDIENKAK